jgi:hypothetical protein
VRRISRTFALLAALLLGAACAVGVAACGGSGNKDDLIPSSDASAMIDQLDAIQNAVDKGRCGNVGNQVSKLQSQINGLSKQVDASLKARLQEGVNNLADIGPSDCFDRKEKTQTTETQTVETQTTETQTTETTPTETTPTETTPTETTPTETVPPPVTTPTETTPVEPPGGATIPNTDPSTPADGGTGGATPGTATP